jgi:RHS repeat-associated protein
MTKAVQSGTTVQTNAYDADGNRVQQVAGGSTFTYSYPGLNILYEKNVTGTTTSITKHFYAGGLQVAKMVGIAIYYLHQDALGGTRLETTSTATVKFSSNYVPYGNNYGVSGKEVFMYTGKLFDSATGLYYYGARYYDTTTGRFVTQDSFGGKPTDPQSLNRYIYARDNPEKMMDSNGHMALRIDSEDDTKKSVPSTGVLFSSFNLQASIKASQLPVLTDMRKVSYTPSPLVTTIGTGVTPADWKVPMIGLAGGGGPTGASSTVTQGTRSSGFNWNAAGSLLILVGSVMATTAITLTGAGGGLALPLLGGFLSADESTFNYLNGNPNPTIQGAENAWTTGFTFGVISTAVCPGCLPQ